MRNSIKMSMITLICCGMIPVVTAQSQPPEPPASVERSSFGIQAGLIAFFVNHELGLTHQLVLRTELGIHGIIYDQPQGAVVSFTLGVIVEPRWYYNLAKRKEQGKDIAGNSGNFVALRLHYQRTDFASDVNGANIISIAPMWGIRRNLGSHFNYEMAFGVGWRKTSLQREDTGSIGSIVLITESPLLRNLAPYLHLRIGYRF